MQGLEHIEDVIIGFILALLDGFGDELMERRLLQLIFLQKILKVSANFPAPFAFECSDA